MDAENASELTIVNKPKYHKRRTKFRLGETVECYRDVANKALLGLRGVIVSIMLRQKGAPHYYVKVRADNVPGYQGTDPTIIFWGKQIKRYRVKDPTIPTLPDEPAGREDVGGHFQEIVHNCGAVNLGLSADGIVRLTMPK